MANNNTCPIRGNPLIADRRGFVYYNISHYGGIPIDRTRKIFLHLIRELSVAKSIDESFFAAVCDELLNHINTLDKVYEADEELGMLLHDGIDIEDPDYGEASGGKYTKSNYLEDISKYFDEHKDEIKDDPLLSDWDLEWKNQK